MNIHAMISWQNQLLQAWLRFKLETAKISGYDKGVTFEFSHFMSPQSPRIQSGHLYDRYKKYFNFK
jgi:hypothetical protein